MQNITYYKIWPRNQVKEENQTWRGHELRNLLIYKRSLYYKNISFRTKIFRISPKTDSIEANLPKRQLVLCTNLWCNSVSKPLLQKINTCFYIAAWLPPPTNSKMWFLWERGKLRSPQKPIKMALKQWRSLSFIHGVACIKPWQKISV